MSILGTQLSIQYPAGDEEGDCAGADCSKPQSKDDGDGCRDCGAPLYEEVNLIGSRTLHLPMAHRCSA